MKKFLLKIKHVFFNFFILSLSSISASSVVLNEKSFDYIPFYMLLSQTPNQNGKLDKTFGNANTGTQGTTFLTPKIASGSFDFLYSMILDSYQNIICAGYSDANLGNNYFSIASFLPSGAINLSFNEQGLNNCLPGTNYVHFSITDRTNPLDQCLALTETNNGYVLGGYSIPQSGPARFAIAEFTKNGKLNPLFGGRNNGTNYINTRIAGAGTDSIQALITQSDGKIIAAGTSNVYFSLARFLPNGTLDTSFGGGNTGYTFLNAFIGGDAAGSICNAVGLQSNGNIILAGQTLTATPSTHFAVARYTNTGILDLTFGGNGTGYTFITPTIAGGTEDVCNALAIQSDNKIVLAGYTNNTLNQSYFALARFNEDGTLDENFGTNGKTYISTFIASGPADVIFSIKIQADKKIIVAGRSANSFAFARFNEYGALDQTFGINGVFSFTATNLIAARSIALTDTAIFVAGSANSSSFFSICKLLNIPSATTFKLENLGKAGFIS